jgi:uncharacterized OsmC-like protein
MVKIQATYRGDKRCQVVHPQSGSEIETDAPLDNEGKGERFSPTDLVAAAIATCPLTIIANVAERDGLDVRGASARVEKYMTDNPRRIGRLEIHLKLPAQLDEKQRKKLERWAETCPVFKSLHPETEVKVTYFYE